MPYFAKSKKQAQRAIRKGDCPNCGRRVPGKVGVYPDVTGLSGVGNSCTRTRCATVATALLK